MFTLFKLRTRKRKRRGFTLIELLLSIGIIAILAGIVIVAINPTRQFAQTRNAMRRSDAKQILNAIQQYKVENEGDLPPGIASTMNMIGTDTTGCNTLCSGSYGSATDFSVRVNGPDNDAEEREDGSMYMDSSDLELIYGDDNDQVVGMRFQNVLIPNGAIILSATIEFTADEGRTGATNLVFSGEASDHAAIFVNENSNISSRTLTTASVAWDNVPPWNTVPETHQTPDLSNIVQEIVDRPGWSNGNSMVFIVNGSGRRNAESYEGEPTMAPLLIIQYQTADGEMTPGSCIDLGASLVSKHLQSMPVDPSNGTNGNTNYAVRELEDGRLRVRSCGAEIDEEIFVDQ